MIGRTRITGCTLFSHEKLSEDMNKYKPAAKLDKMLKEFEELKVKHVNDSEYNLMMPSNSFV